MQVQFKFQDPKDLQCNVAIGATIAELEQLRNQLMSGSWPSTALGAALTEALTQANKVFYGSAP